MQVTEVAGEKTESTYQGLASKSCSEWIHLYRTVGFFVVVFQKTVPKKTFAQMTSHLDY